MYKIYTYIFGFHKIRGISWLAENLLASQEGFCPMERACKQASQPTSLYKICLRYPNLTTRNNKYYYYYYYYYYYLHVINYKTWHFYEIHQLLFQKLRVLCVMLITIGKNEGCKGGICPSNIFLRLRRFFGHRVKEGQIRNINISEWLIGWCKDREGLKKLAFYGTQNKSIWVAHLQRKSGTVHLAPSPNIIIQVTPMCNTQRYVCKVRDL
jgi:hypothetical protein